MYPTCGVHELVPPSRSRRFCSGIALVHPTRNAYLAEPHDRARRRRAALGPRLARRLDDHHPRLTDPRRQARPRSDAPAGDRGPRASQRNTVTTLAEPTFVSSLEGQAIAALYGHVFSTTAEIGAATGIEF